MTQLAGRTAPSPGCPVPVRNRRFRGPLLGRLLAAALLLPLLAVGGWLAWQGLRALLPLHTPPATHTVRRGRLEPRIVVRGDLVAIESADIVCRVRTRLAGQPYTAIKWVIENGTHVTEGQLLCELDDAFLHDELYRRRVQLSQAEAEWQQAEQDCRILASQNESDIRAAEVAVELATLDLEKFRQGDALLTQRDLHGQLFLAESNRDSWQERAAWAQHMARRGFVSGAQVQAEQFRLLDANRTVDRVREELRVFEQHTRRRTLADLEGKLDEARRARDRVRLQARARAVQAEADRLAKQRIYKRRLQRCRDVAEQIPRCCLYAPRDGLVMHHIPEQTWAGTGLGQSIIAPGEPVREGQVLMRIPDQTRLQVRTWIHEALVSRVQGETWEPTGFGDCLQAALLAGPDPWTTLVAQAAFPQIRKHYQSHERRLVSPGQRAEVRLEAYPDRVFEGHVSRVAGSATLIDYMGSLLAYQTFVVLDETAEGVRPDLTAEVTIPLEDGPEDVLTVPVETLIRTPGRGRHCTCLVLTPDGPQERDVVVGLHDGRQAEVCSGLAEGDEVLLDPRDWLSEHGPGHAAGHTGSDAYLGLRAE